MDELIAWPTLNADIDGHETVWRRKDGESIHVALTIAVIPGAKGEPAGVSLIAYDISEQKHVEQLSERLLAESEARARTDPLTGLANRRAWDEELHRELARAARQGWPVCVAMIDLDHFKAFNDERGHLSGDELLAEAATTWRVELRDGDFIARYGGEEFGVLLPNCSIGDAAQVVERLRATTPMGQTCSAGLARWDGSESAAELLRRTDAALYAAKRAGRDRLLTG
jgi:diguanylate cyclase (GGDEF)-like protein